MRWRPRPSARATTVVRQGPPMTGSGAAEQPWRTHFPLTTRRPPPAKLLILNCLAVILPVCVEFRLVALETARGADSRSCVQHRDFPGTSAQTIGNKESVAPRSLPPETFPQGSFPAHLDARGDHVLPRVSRRVATRHAGVRAPRRPGFRPCPTGVPTCP